MLHVAASAGFLDIVQYLVDIRRLNINARSEEGLTPLHIACRFQHLEVVKYLVVDRRARVKTADSDGLTALHFAINNVPDCRAYLRIAEVLVDQGADIEARDYLGLTPLAKTDICDGGRRF